MKSILPAFTCAAVYVFPALVTGQSPPAKVPADGQAPPAHPAQPAVVLQSLQLLTSATIHHRQPLAAGGDAAAHASGTAAFVPFARVRDASFARSGRLIALHVEAIDADPGQPPARKLLPAQDVSWDEATGKWLTSDGNLRLAGLADVRPTVPAAEPTSDLAKSERPLLASTLLQATWGGFAADERSTEATPEKAAAPAAVLWLHPTHLCLAFAVVPHGTKFLPLPWPLLQVSERDAVRQLLVDAAPARLDDSPTCKDALEAPDAALRRRCYVHFGLPIPLWDCTAADTAEASAKQPPAKRADREERQ